MSLVELLMALALLGVVTLAITTAFASAIRAESDLEHRFESQQAVRLGLDKLRSDVHCASAETPTSGTVTSVTLTIPSGCSVPAGSITWCAVSGSGGYDLWRIPGTSCTTSASGSVRWSSKMTSQSVFTPDATVHAGAPVLPSVAVSLAVSSAGRRYTAADTVYLRNGIRQ